MLYKSDEQTQEVAEGGTAIQAKGNVTVNNGLSVGEVRELCSLFFRDNFPQLREEARRTAEDQVQAFVTSLESRLIDDAVSIAFEKFCEPDVQAAINDAVLANARRGAASNPTVLSSLISERVSKSTNSYKDIVLSEAVNVVPRLTGHQIALLSFVHFVRSMIFQNLPDIGALEHIGKLGLAFSESGFGLSNSQKQHLQYAGAASVNNLLGGDVYDVQREEYNYLGIADKATFKAALSSSAPSYLRLLEQFALDQLFTVNLTSVGQAIAVANISNYMGKLDYTIWLN